MVGDQVSWTKQQTRPTNPPLGVAEKQQKVAAKQQAYLSIYLSIYKQGLVQLTNCDWIILSYPRAETSARHWGEGQRPVREWAG